MMLAFSACGTFLIHSGFKSAREKDIQNGYNNASVVCINLVQNVKRTINLVYRDTGYEKQKNVVVRQAAQSVSVRNAGEEVQFAIWTDEKTRIYSTNGLKGADVSICRDDLEAGQEGYKIVKRNGRYMLYTGTSFQVLDRVYYVETFSDITRDYENRDAQLRMFRMIMIIVMIVCLMLMAILNNMIVVPIRRLSKATKLVAGGRAGIRIRKRSKDEIGVLAEDFNRMSTSLNRTMKELEEKTKSQEMFTNNFAHELKTPLTSMIGYADLIRSNQLSEEKLITYANQIVVEGRRLEKMSMKLMDLIVLKKQDFLFYDMEMPLIYVLADMEKYGIKVDKAALLAYQKRLGESLDGMEEEIYALAGEKFNINSPKQLGVILFEKLGLKGGKKTKTGYSTAADVLEKLRTAHPIVERILHYRQLAKLKSTYADGLLAVMDAETEKIYSTFNQTITATGRISSTEPNLQNIPVRLELGRELRKIFIPESAEFCFLDADYSQIELRVLAHISGDESLIAAFKSNQDIHRMTASQVFHVPFDEVTPLQRSNAKAVNFGIIYGKGAFSLGQDLGISRKEAEEYINAYFARYPKIKTFMEDTIKNGTKNGYVSTLWNRRRNMPELQSSNFMQRAAGERAAMNMPIQGTAADIIKLAMIKVHRALQEGGYRSRLILQVHDELLIEAYKEEKEAVAKILKENMEHAADLLVPLDVDVHEGASWFEAK